MAKKRSAWRLSTILLTARPALTATRRRVFCRSKGAKDVGVEFITMSKPYNMAGFRIGFVAGNKDMINYLATIKGYYDYGIFQAVQIAGIIAMRHCDKDVSSPESEVSVAKRLFMPGFAEDRLAGGKTAGIDVCLGEGAAGAFAGQRHN